jgi:hypothetical protein
MWEAAARGERDRRVKDVAMLCEICNSITLVVPEDPNQPVPLCEANVAKLDHPGCKGFKGHGICSHVLAVNHILTQYDVRKQLRTIGKSAASKKANGGGNQKSVPKALQKAPVREPDSSDEEDERLAALSAQGL